MSSVQDFKRRLQEQLRFLKRSAEAFDEGDIAEAVRIATALRVMFHDTKNSTSLLKHLNSLHVAVRSVASDRQKIQEELGGRRIVGEFSCSLALIVLSTPSQFLPIIRPALSHRFISASDWWNETVAVFDNVEYKRRSVVLWAADKDGGAHVDASFPPAYQSLKAKGAAGSFELSDGTVVEIENAHFTFLRTMAFEVLNTPAIHQLILED